MSKRKPNHTRRPDPAVELEEAALDDVHGGGDLAATTRQDDAPAGAGHTFRSGKMTTYDHNF